jgi:excinuclease UvrABC nuclease subunit
MRFNPDDYNPFYLDGWKTGTTYGAVRHQDEIPNESGLYAITYLKEDIKTHKIVYIGMSTNLKTRLIRSNHEVMRKVESVGIFGSFWFKKYPLVGLYDLETEFIQKYNPSYNIRQKARSI